MSAHAPAGESDSPVLFVDLDGSLLRCDLLHESIAQLALRRPLRLAMVLIRHLFTPAGLKQALAELYMPDAATLPYRSDVLELIESRRRTCRIVLATASPRQWAGHIADHLQIFDDVLATDGANNLKGRRKLDAIEEWCRKNEAVSWGYIGDSASDVVIWQAADEAWSVGGATPFHKAMPEMKTQLHSLGGRTSPLASIGGLLRVQQWVKNLLVLVPMPLSRTPPTWPMFAAGLLATLAFCLISSGIYIINDILDLQADRTHPWKRNRPLAAGSFPILLGLPLAAALLLAGAGVAVAIGSAPFAWWLAGYVALTTAYSLKWKQIPVVDVVTLASLYMLRIVAGGAATSVPITEWLVAFSMFFFLSLGLAKRHAELFRLARSADNKSPGRGYVATDATFVQTLGITSGMLSVLVFAFFAHSDETRAAYPHAAALWCVCPLLTLWLGRVWLLASRGQLHEDPVSFAVKDQASLLTGVAIFGVVVYARGAFARLW